MADNGGLRTTSTSHSLPCSYSCDVTMSMMMSPFTSCRPAMRGSSCTQDDHTESTYERVCLQDCTHGWVREGRWDMPLQFSWTKPGTPAGALHSKAGAPPLKLTCATRRTACRRPYLKGEWLARVCGHESCVLVGPAADVDALHQLQVELHLHHTTRHDTQHEAVTRRTRPHIRSERVLDSGLDSWAGTKLG